MRSVELLWLVGLLGACAAPQAKEQESFDSGEPVIETCSTGGPGTTFLMHRVSFARSADGIAWGSNLDGEVSTAGDGTGCNKPDLVSPEGTEGIDNAFAGLLPALEQTEAAAISGLLQDSVEQGELLLTIEVLGLDDMRSDDCVDVAFGNAEGAPLIGTDGVILAGQSFERPDASVLTVVEEEVVEDGRITFTADFGIKLQILDADLNLLVRQGEVRMDMAPDGQSAVGHFTGGVSIEYMLAEINSYAIDPDLKDLVNLVLPGVGDLQGPEGECDYMSIAFEFEAIPGYFYEN